MTTQAQNTGATSGPGPVAAAVLAGTPLTAQQAAAALRQARNANGEVNGAKPDAARTDANRDITKNPISDAARTLGQRAQAARQERQAEAARQAEESAETTESEAEGGDVEDEPEAGSDAEAEGTQDELTTANGESSTETETDANTVELAEGQTIDLGEGVRVTRDEIRDGFMMKADHTRKTQALAAERKQLEADRTQRLSELDKVIAAGKQVLPQAKDLDVFVEELGAEEGLKAYSRQQKMFGELSKAWNAAENEKQRIHLDSEAARDKDLAENYNKAWADPVKRDKAYTELSAYALKDGATPEELRGMTKPWMLKALDKAAKYDALQANKGKVTTMVANKPKVVKPGARLSNQAAGQTSIQNAQAKLKSSGNIADAVQLLRAMRGGKGRSG